MQTFATDIGHLPPAPVISRFVAPWDTSGWYCVLPNFSVGSRLYSNADTRVTALPQAYAGWEYVMTFDSLADGFDDKQEVDFYLEQDATVYVALDARAPTDLLPAYTDTGEELLADNGCAYRILAAGYPAGAQVHIPGFSGEFHHFVVFVRPLREPQPGPACDGAVVQRCDLPPYAGRAYRWYFQEVFNLLPAGEPPAGFVCSGACRVADYPYSMGRRYVLLQNGASLARQTAASGREILELSLQVFSGTAEVQFCGARLRLGDGQATLAGGEPLGCAADGSFDLRLVRCEGEGAAGRCAVWLNNRLCGQVPCAGGQTATFSLKAGEGAAVGLDRLSLRDDPEVFVAWEDFSTLPASLRCSAGAAAVLADYPFAADKSLCLTGGSCSYPFPPVTGALTFETTVQVEEAGFALLPELRSADGQLALRIAMYHNNLYASNGGRWERIFSGDTPWMYYPCGNWYHIRVAVSLAEGRYDLYVDGARRARGFALASPVREIAQAGYLVQSGALYVKELRVYDALTICRGLLPPGPVYDVRSAPYGACGDGVTLDTAALQRAIDDAACTGGTVYLHDGVFLTGSLRLHSDMTFFLDRNATLVGTQDHAQYPLYTPGTSRCAADPLGRGLLYGQNLCNLRITGGGRLDGQGLYRFKRNNPVERLPDARPSLIYLTYSSGIAMEDLQLCGSAFWTVVPLSCRNLLVQYLNLDCMNTPNRDGIDPVDCRDMTIRRCDIMAGDDGLCFKSSDHFGCENIDVADMMIQSLASGIKFGTDTYYSLKNVAVRRCTIKNVNRCGISLESVDGAQVTNVRFEGIDMVDVGAPVYITLGRRQRVPRGGGKRQGSICGVLFQNLRFEKPYPFSHTREIREMMIIGQSRELPVREIEFSDCFFALPGGATRIPGPPEPIGQTYPEYDHHGLSTGHAFCIRYAEGITIRNCRIVLEQPDVRPAVGCADALDVRLEE